MLLVDGHNLVGRWPGLSLAREAEGRETVLRRVAAARGSRPGPVVVVFDGDRPGSAKEERFGGVRVVYAAAGRSADEEILRRLRAKGGRGATVVTSDRGLADRARELGARVESAERFRERVARRPEPAPEKPEPGDDVEEWMRLFTARSEHKM